MTPQDSDDDVVEFGPFRLYVRHRKLLFANREVNLGGRAMDILLALAKNKGNLVTKEQLIEAAWPNVFVDESNVKVTIASLRRALREHAPNHDYITTIIGRGYWLSADLEPEHKPDSGDLSVTIGATLPELGTVIGRDTEIAELRETLAANRSTTIVGPGGVGKTTVAVAVARHLENEGIGVTFVDLSRVASEEYVTSALVTALGITATGDDSLQAVVSILARRKTLLVFDTCEHVLNAVAHICDVVLSKTSDVRILATSRQVLRARYEKVVWLAPLQVPPVEQAGTAHDILRYSAPQLLALRAFENGGYLVEDRDAYAIAEICRRLDGAPLAIELVSSRLAGRTAGTVLTELDDRFRTLRRVSPGGPLRQQTLLVTLEWSYALLTAEEGAVLRAISIFAGSFDMDSAVRVVAHHGFSPADTFDAVAGLRAKSMLSVDQMSGDLRYRLLDSTRAFAGNLLDSHDEWTTVAESHARLQLEILTRAGAEQATMPARMWHATYSGQTDDLRKALDWSLYRAGDPQLGIQLVAAGLPLWHDLSLAEESRRNCERALAEFERIGCTDVALKLKLVVGLATVSTYLSADPEKTIALFETAIQLARQTGDARAECRALGALATYRLLPGHGSAVIGTLQAMRQAAIRANDRAALWEEEQLFAQWEIRNCDFTAAHSRLGRLAEEMRGDAEGAVPRFQIYQKMNVEVQLGALSWLLGKPEQAARIAKDVAEEAIEVDHGLTLIHCLAHGVIWTLVQCRDYVAVKLYVDIFRSAIYRHGMAAWIPVANCYNEVIGALSGDRSDPESLRAAYDDLRAGMVQLGHGARYAMLAEAMLAIGQAGDAAEVIGHIFDSSPDPWGLPELLRLRALAERGLDRDEDAEASLRQALQAAGEIECPAWKLRVAHDLAVLLMDQGLVAEAQQVLRPVYDQFTEGFATGDVEDASKLLDRLHSLVPAQRRTMCEQRCR